MLPETKRKDVSPTELQLRKQDKQTRNLRYFEVVVLVAVVLISVFSLFKLLEIANINRQNIEIHRIQNEDVHRDLEDLICDIIMKRPADQVSDGQRKACDGKGT